MNARWVLADGAAFVAGLAQWAQDRGYLLALYGSTLSGSGRDLDLIAVPWRTGTNAEAFLTDFVFQCGGTVRERGPGLFAQDAAAIEVDGRIVDIQVRRGVLETPGSASPTDATPGGSDK